MKDAKHLDRVRSLGCLICGCDAIAHHINCRGMGVKSSDYQTLPLCPKHHNIDKMSIHLSPVSFQNRYGLERELLEDTYIKLNKEFEGIYSKEHIEKWLSECMISTKF